ncbi:DUF3352 domain-containing protein [Capillimicrobium parvum]|uniref:DUF3352 domain-containing protein n=1 Tax=Capillimicrobium parvum TaxID=2884022 RepID=A0A9E6XWM2_9ACTN|nr:DUF3352 domain-containing protein [Capillimicrobium parvum]UGS35799.1 hypothetical protein DSM104329_02195 [Capillimicrobium parvum]
MPDEVVRRRRRLALLAATALIVVIAVVAVLLTRGGASGAPIAEEAASLVPSDAIVYVHVSTDGDRGAVKDARKLAGSFDGYERLRDSVLSRLSVGGGGRSAVSPWLGDEMALALLGPQGETAGSLVLLSVRDRDKARAFVREGARRSGPSRTYKGVTLARYGAVYAAFIGDFLALGQQASLQQAIDLQQGRGEALARDATFAKLTTRLPSDRVADAYATADGLRRLLVPAGGALGVAGVVLDRPNLRGTAVAVQAEDPGLVLTVAADVPGRKAQPLDPALLSSVPKNALAYFGSRGLDQSAGRLLAAAGTSALGDLIRQGRRALGAEGARSVGEDLLALLERETAVVLLPGVPAPTLLVMAKTENEERTRAALKRLTDALPGLLPGGKVTQADGVTKVTSDQAELDATVSDGKLMISTGMVGIDAARSSNGGIEDADAFKATVPDARSGDVTSLVFLDFSQLLRLAEQTGLNDSRAYLAVKDDLTRVRAVGVRSTGEGEDTTSEIRFQIP